MMGSPSIYEASSPQSVAVAGGGGAIAAEPGSTTGDTHVSYGVNPWIETTNDALSTFAADVDTASYTYARRTLQGGALPPPSPPSVS